MAKAELKTKATNQSVSDFIESVKDLNRQNDSKTILNLMQQITKDKPKLWGSSIVGFVDVQLKYESGRELDWFKIGFSPRKQALTLYGLLKDDSKAKELFAKLGKYTTGKGCLYIKKLSDVDLKVLEGIIKHAVG